MRQRSRSREGIRSVLTYLERGGNFIDTARHYGQSEVILGKALKQWKGEKLFIATKVQSHGRDNTRWAIPPPLEATFPRHLIRQNAEESLRLLGVDCLDCLQLHLYWPNWGVSGYWLDELNTLKEEGKIGSIGVSLPDHRCAGCLHGPGAGDSGKKFKLPTKGNGGMCSRAVFSFWFIPFLRSYRSRVESTKAGFTQLANVTTERRTTGSTSGVDVERIRNYSDRQYWL